MSFTNPVLVGEVGSSRVSPQSVYAVATTAAHARGTRGMLSGGRWFEYVRHDLATAIPKGNLACYDPVVAAVDKIAIQATAAVGTTSIPVTVTITIDANELAGSYIGIEKANGLGETYRIISHASHTSGTLTLEVNRGVVVELTTSSRATIYFMANAVKKSAAVAAEAVAIEVAAGVPLVTIPDGSSTVQYSWVQKTGFAIVLFCGAVGAVGQVIGYGDDVGSFGVSVENESIAQLPQLGVICSLLPIDVEYHGVMLSIA